MKTHKGDSFPAQLSGICRSQRRSPELESGQGRTEALKQPQQNSFLSHAPTCMQRARPFR